MKKFPFIILGLLAFGLSPLHAGTNLQLYYDFGSLGTACPNQRTNRVTSTVELFYPDNWGSTFAFIDIDYNINPQDPDNTPFGTYWEISRCFNFWSKTKAKDLSLHLEYDGGLGIGKASDGKIYGYGINHAVLTGLNYLLYTPDWKNTFNLELLFRYDAGHMAKVPLQFTFVWNCQDFCTAPGLSFTGFLDIAGYNNSWNLISEPQLWYQVGRHFKCPNLHIGTEIEFSYNFPGTTGKGFMVNPCLGIKWAFD